jgi:hypothetical protein
MTKLRGAHGVKVGLPNGSNDYPDGTSVIDVGLWNEFGTKHIPERSFLRSGIRQNLDAYRSMNKRHLRLIQFKKMKAAQALGRLGILASGHIVGRIDDVRTPPNSEQTIAQKGSSNPLVDTGHLKQSITHEVLTRA